MSHKWWVTLPNIASFESAEMETNEQSVRSVKNRFHSFNLPLKYNFILRVLIGEPMKSFIYVAVVQLLWYDPV